MCFFSALNEQCLMVITGYREYSMYMPNEADAKVNL